MNVYVETNFLLELVFEQEQSASCEQILQHCETGRDALIVPAYSLAEPHERLIRLANSRRNLHQQVETELRQLARTSSYSTRVASISDVARLIIQSNEEEQRRFVSIRERVLRVGAVVPLTTAVLLDAASYESRFDLRPQDALVYASVLSHLKQNAPASACFLNRNSKDFDNPDIDDELKKFNCKVIARFDHGLSFLQSSARNAAT